LVWRSLIATGRLFIDAACIQDLHAVTSITDHMEILTPSPL